MFPAQFLRTLGAAIADSPNETNWAIDLANVFAESWFILLLCIWRFNFGFQLLLGFNHV